MRVLSICSAKTEALQTVVYILELATLLVFPVTWMLPGP